MKEFIEVHVHAPGTEIDRMPVMINLDWVEEICKDKEGRADIYLAFNSPSAYEQDRIKTVEGYEGIKADIKRRIRREL